MTKSKEGFAPTRSLFDRLASHYDRGNRVISLGQDLRWKRRAVALLDPQRHGQYLDCGSGTGDLTRMILARSGGQCEVTALDASSEMLQRGGLPHLAHVTALVGDAQNPPLPDASVEGIVSGFLLRNLPDLDRFFASMHRILRPGGRLVVLEIAYPPGRFSRGLFKLYFHGVAPVLGGLATGRWAAYRYLSRSLRSFPDPHRLARMAEHAGLGPVQIQLSRRLGFFLLATQKSTQESPEKKHKTRRHLPDHRRSS